MATMVTRVPGYYDNAMQLDTGELHDTYDFGEHKHKSRLEIYDEGYVPMKFGDNSDKMLRSHTSFMAVKESNPGQSNHQHQREDQQICDPCKSFGQKCSHLVKKQRAKFYIVRRCIAMLLCWHERGEH